MEHGDWLTVIDNIGPGFAQGADVRDEKDEFIASHYAVLKEHGLMAAMVPSELGGGGASHSTLVAMVRRLGYHDGPTALAYSMHQHLVAAQVFNYLQGHPAPILTRIAAEQLVLVSTGARDWLESNGEARSADGGYRVTARKAFASGSPAGDIAITSSPFNDPKMGWQVLHFAIPLKAEGVRLEDDWRAHGMRSTGSQTVVMEDVFVSDAAISLRRPRGSFHPIWNVVLTVALPLITAAYVGVAERAAKIASGLARRNAREPSTQWAAGEMKSALVTACALHDRMTALANDLDFEPSLDLTDEMLVLKTQVVGLAQKAVESAVEAVGGPAFYRETGLERLLRDVRAGDFHPLPARHQMQFTGRRVLGLEPVEAWSEPADTTLLSARS